MPSIFRKRRFTGVFLLGLCATIARAQDEPGRASSAAQAPALSGSGPAKAIADSIDKIKQEGTERSQVMQTLSYLTDVIGPRLTNSPEMKRANEWTRDKMTEWGLDNAHLEAWGPFGRGWSLKSYSAQVVEPQCIPLIAFPKAWSPGLEAPVTGDLVHFTARTEGDFEAYKGRLKNAIVLIGSPRDLKAWFEPPGQRLTDERLLSLANAPEPGPRGQRRQAARQRRDGEAQRPALPPIGFVQKRTEFLLSEGAAVTIEPSFRGDGGTLFVQSASVPTSASPRRTPWEKDAPKTLPQLVCSIEHFNRMVRMIGFGEKPRVSVDLKVEFHDQDLMGYNTIAEIEGTDLKDEVVMLGGHLDSWHGGTGATDNAAGCAVGMEALRILEALDLEPRRTIRLALWSGEEQGLHGSRAYVREHFGAFEDSGERSAGDTLAALWSRDDGRPLVVKPEYEKFSVYFNLDNGTGKIRGVYMEGNEAVRPIFRRWLQPFRDLGAATLSISRTGGTDHMSFDAIGLPGFQFIQDPIEYETRTHHSNQDVYERLQADDLKQASVIMASFVYNAAMIDERIPRKPLTVPLKPAGSVQEQAQVAGGGR
jgi:hypothetical protein